MQSVLEDAVKVPVSQFVELPVILVHVCVQKADGAALVIAQLAQAAIAVLSQATLRLTVLYQEDTV
jgi:hypothetical protein